MVLWMVLREALSLVVVGAVIGLPLAFVAGRSMQTLLFGVGAADPLAFVGGRRHSARRRRRGSVFACTQSVEDRAHGRPGPLSGSGIKARALINR